MLTLPYILVHNPLPNQELRVLIFYLSVDSLTYICTILDTHLHGPVRGNNTHVPTVGSLHNVSTAWLANSVDSEPIIICQIETKCDACSLQLWAVLTNQHFSYKVLLKLNCMWNIWEENCFPFFSGGMFAVFFVNFHWGGVMCSFLANEWDFGQVCIPILPLIWHREDWWERHDGANAYLVQQLTFGCYKSKFMILNLIP